MIITHWKVKIYGSNSKNKIKTETNTKIGQNNSC